MTHATLANRSLRLPPALNDAVEAAIKRAVDGDWASRIWRRDASLWTQDEHTATLIGGRLGWLDAPAAFSRDVDELAAFARGVVDEGFTDALVCGMGGSSLAAEVLASSYPLGTQGIPVRVLDSTDPAAVRAATEVADPLRTLYLIASKSGTTTETLAFLAHFWEIEHRLHRAVPEGAPARHFIAVSDPGRNVAELPHSDLFRETFLNPPDVGGRYSALTYVGLVPAALLGLDLTTLLADAVAMAGRCRDGGRDNPGLALGVALGTLAAGGRDKLTFVIEPRCASFGAWAEQLIAESTGKRAVGIVPVDGEPLAAPAAYGDDRVFVRISSGFDSEWQQRTDALLEALAAAGQPVIDLALGDSGGLGGEFFRWEFATAVAGAVLAINPFDEPNVSESKENTRRVLDVYRSTGGLPPNDVIATEPPLSLVADAPLRLTAEHGSVGALLGAHLTRVPLRGYIGLHAYVADTPEREAALRSLATRLRDQTGRPVTVGFGPRFLHSTGQLHKGGPPTGCFVQLVAEHPDDLPIPGAHETFGMLIDAQAAGDFVSLESHDLPVLRIGLGADVEAGLAALDRTLAVWADEASRAVG